MARDEKATVSGEGANEYEVASDYTAYVRDAKRGGYLALKVVRVRTITYGRPEERTTEVLLMVEARRVVNMKTMRDFAGARYVIGAMVVA